MSEPREPDLYLIGHVHEALAEDARVNELDVDVSLRGDDVFLTGVVATEARQRAVGDVVAGVLPDHRVHNEVTVMHYPEPAGEERLR